MASATKLLVDLPFVIQQNPLAIQLGVGIIFASAHVDNAAQNLF
jgi:hypothetical protein